MFMTMAPISAITGLGCIFLLVIFINNCMVNSATFHWASSQKLAAASAPGKVQREARLATKAQPGIQMSWLLTTRPPYGRRQVSGWHSYLSFWKSTLLTGGLTALSTADPSAENTITNTTTLLSARHSSVLAASPFLMQSKTNSSHPKDDSPSNCRTQNLSG